MSGGGGIVGEEDVNVEAGHLWEKQDDCSLCGCGVMVSSVSVYSQMCGVAMLSPLSLAPVQRRLDMCCCR